MHDHTCSVLELKQLIYTQHTYLFLYYKCYFYYIKKYWVFKIAGFLSWIMNLWPMAQLVSYSAIDLISWHFQAKKLKLALDLVKALMVWTKIAKKSLLF